MKKSALFVALLIAIACVGTLKASEPATTVPATADGGHVAPTKGSSQRIQDGSFEAGSGSQFWTHWSSAGRPVITNLQWPGPFDGSWWAWFSAGSVTTDCSVQQQVHLPAGASATLTFQIWRPSTSYPGSNFSVTVDGTEIFSTPGGSPAFNDGYTLVSRDVSAFADGGNHNLRFRGSMQAFDEQGFCLDVVGLWAPDPACANASVQPCTHTLIYPPDGATTPLQPTFEWQCVNDITEYSVYLEDDEGWSVECTTSTESCLASEPLAEGSTYRVYVRASGPHGPCETAIHTFSTETAPVADFGWAPQVPAVDQTVEFEDLSTNNPTAWSWDFGDGGTSSEQNPSHAFTAVGIYTVTLTVSNSVGSDSASQQLVVGGVPTASFTWDPLLPDVNEDVSFADTSGGFPSAWSWDFGDGGTSSDQNPVYSYQQSGVYTVTLTASNAAGESTASNTIFVALPPQAGFSWTPELPGVDEEVLFTDTSVGHPNSWRWNFGDGGTSRQQNPAHTFTAAGVYTVTLTASNRFGSNAVSTTLPVSAEFGMSRGPEVEVGEPGAEVGTEIASATDRAGNRIVVWKEIVPAHKGLAGDGEPIDQDGVESIFARTFNRDGQPLTPPILVEEGGSGELESPSVTVDGSGDFVVSWKSSPSGEATAVFARTFAAEGSPTGEAFQVDDLGGEPTDPEITTNNAGEIAVVWTQAGLKTLQAEGVFARFFNADSTPTGPSLRVDESPFGDASQPELDSDASGDTWVVWQQGAVSAAAAGVDKTLQDATAVFARLFAPSGQATTEPVEVTSGPTGPVGDPDVSADAVGNGVVVWSEEVGKDGDLDIFARMFSRNGQPTGEQFQVNSDPAGDQLRPSVDVNPQGDFVVLWETRATAKTLNGVEGVFGRFFDAEGTPLGPDFEVATTQADVTPSSPDVTIANDDSVTAAYVKTDSDGTGTGAFIRTFTVTNPIGQCTPDATTLCVNRERFQVRVAWRDPLDQTSVARAVPLTDDTGYVWFFQSSNVELVLKVLDGTWYNDHWWVFFASLSNVEYNITVTDVISGNSVTYHNPIGNFASVGDTEALPEGSDKSMPRHRQVEIPPTNTSLADARLYTELMRLDPSRAPSKVRGSCVPQDDVLCLNDNRFALTATWEDFEHQTGNGWAVPLTDDTGYFWFFDDANVELVIKALDGTANNQHCWVFYGALSNTGFAITVTDTVTGAQKTYQNPLGTFASVGDTVAFPGP